MRLSEWRASSPSKDGRRGRRSPRSSIRCCGRSAPSRIRNCWVAWGEEPAVRYTIFVPTAAGLDRVLRPGQRLRRGAAGNRQAHPLEPRPARRAVDRDPGGPSPAQLPGRATCAPRRPTRRQIASPRFALELFAAVDGRVLPPEASREATHGRQGRRRAVRHGREAGTSGGLIEIRQGRRRGAPPADEPRRPAERFWSRR